MFDSSKAQELSASSAMEADTNAFLARLADFLRANPEADAPHLDEALLLAMMDD